MFQLHVSSVPQLSGFQLPWLLLLANIAVASLLVCGLTLLVERIWPRRTLPLRHTILLAGLVMTLAVPLLVGAIDATGLSLIEITSERPAVATAQSTNSPPLGEVISGAQQPLQPNDLPANVELPAEQGGSPQIPVAATSGSADHAIERALDPPAEPMFTWRNLLWAGLALTLVWALGSLVELVRFTQGLLLVRRFLQTVEPVADPRLQRLARAAAQSVGLKHSPPLGQSLAIETPVSVGILRGQVVLPARQLHEWSDDAWRALLLHEMAHLRRRDLLVGLLQRVALVLYWWNPLLRRVSAHIAVLREQICDDLVTQHGSQEDRYAALIVELAGRVVTQRQLGPVLGPMLGAADGTPSELATRIRRLLDPHRQLATTLSRPLQCAVVAFCIALVLGISTTSIHWVRAQEEQPAKSQVDDAPAQPATDKSEPSDTLHKKIRVVDEQGRPIAGATVTPWAIRTTTHLHGPWSKTNLGRSEPPVATTDADGRATIAFPRYVIPEEQVSALELTCRVSHPGFAETSYNAVRVAESDLAVEQVIELQVGAQVEIVALDGDKPLPAERLYAMWSSPAAARETSVTSDGALLLPRLPAGDELVRIAYLPRDGAPMLSDVQSLKLTNGERNPLRVSMKPALTIVGRLDDSVPRPVSNGRVVADVIDRVKNGRTLNWRTSAEIKADGTFKLAPVPQGNLQVIALCDGFSAANGEMPEFGKEDHRAPGLFNLPQVFPIDVDHQNITLKMRPTAECTVRVVDSEGKPVPDAKVAFGPNVGWWNGGAQIYCEPLTSSAQVITAPAATDASGGKGDERLYSAKTGADGVAVVSNLPVYDASFVVMHDKFELPIVDKAREARISLKPGSDNEITVRLEPKGTSFLGDISKAKRPAPAKPTTPAKLSEKQILVLDPDGRPLAGASVTPQSVRVRGSRDWTSFDTLTFKPEPWRSVTTDAKGIARVPLAPQVAEQASAINCQVEHPKFAIVRESDVRLDESDVAKVATINMLRGARLTITPKASEVKFDPAALHVMWSGREEDFQVHVTDAGRIELPPLPAGGTIYRVIYLPKNGPAMFSEAEEVELVDGQPVQATVTMHPAVRLSGKFDANVSRPVKNGIVMAQILNMYNSNRRLRWRVWAKVADDGSFVLEPVPRGNLQVIGMSDGFTAVSTGRNVFQRRPQVFEVSGDEAAITLKMEPAAELEVHVVDESGQPVDHAHCLAMPQVNWIGRLGGENQFYTLPRYSSIDMLNGITIDERSRMMPNPAPFSGKTDKSGLAVLKDLPPGTNEVMVSGPKMRTFRVELDSGSRRAVTIKFDERQAANLEVVPTVPVTTP